MSEEVKNVEAEPTDAAQDANAVPQAPQGPDLNISDLMSVKNVVEVAVSRGAFKATELEAVGKVFNKLNAFLEAVAKKEA
jgi:hypothetical protein